MALSTVTDGNVDTAAAAVPFPFGPLTRVGSVVDAAPNSQFPIEFTLAAPYNAISVNMSYDQISDLDTVTLNIKNQLGMQAVVFDLVRAVRVFDRYAEQESIPPASSPEYQRLLNILRHVNTLFGMIPNIAAYEYNTSARIEADFTVADAGVGLIAAVTPTITGEVTAVLWEWGDGDSTVETVAPYDPANHTYAGADTYDVTMTAIGRGGLVVVQKSVVIA